MFQDALTPGGNAMAPTGQKKKGMLPVALNPLRYVPNTLNPVHQLRVLRRLLRRQSKKAGLPPGTVVHTGPQKVEEVRVSAFDFDEEKCLEVKDVEDVAALFPMRDKPTVTWVNIDGLHDTQLIEKIGSHYGFHPLVLEDIVHVGQRPKLEEYDDYLYVVLYQLEWQGDEAMVTEEQVSLIIGKNYLFSFQERPGDDFETVRERLRSARGKTRQRGSDYLAYQLIDSTVDNYFTMLDRIGHLTEQVEIELLENPTADTMHRMQQIKREMLVVRRAIWPLRDVLAGLLRTDSELISEPTRVYLRDVHDHAVQVVDMVETLRDVVGGMIEIYLAQVSLKTNEVMKVLTMMASIFIPLTFIVGVYGMNFDFMPELHTRWAYPAVWAVMIGIAGGILFWFKKRRWL
jgi:magnesium transporter